MYCETCVPIREEARGTTSHIIGSLYLSDMKAARTFDGLRMCVHEMGPTYEGQCYFIPILVTKPISKWDRSGALASEIYLDYAAEIIDEHVRKDEQILVHCMGGVERSPLTIAWYLVRTGQYASLTEAYEFLKSKRPVVSQRLFWLPQDGS